MLNGWDCNTKRFEAAAKQRRNLRDHQVIIVIVCGHLAKLRNSEDDIITVRQTMTGWSFFHDPYHSDIMNMTVMVDPPKPHPG